MDDFDEACVEVWPDNLHAVNVFILMDTQWRTGMAGRTGLDYAALPVVLDAQAISDTERGDVFECVRVMEGEALRIFSKER